MSQVLEAAIRLRVLLSARFVNDLEAIDNLSEGFRVQGAHLQGKLEELASLSEGHDSALSRSLAKVESALNAGAADVGMDSRMGETVGLEGQWTSPGHGNANSGWGH